ncbi:MAG: right-handed parallel beta-helix repeat-containing protein [Thermoplasmata archaeon]|uniref:Right-handed parallel beta-helix repeat-containing protein n=1 Tax=Candidatus Sysuiplasma superficiale TaxID=2823368 RepID=A0A8J7YQ51_9ARCH|nr:right-handed parallel beta-helix repeat-containing protein [Candidatus Sysuiplasma superficiale]
MSFLRGTDLNTENCTFINNSIDNDYDDSSSGGAVSYSMSNNVSIKGCTFIANGISSPGAGGAVYSSNNTILHIDNCIFINNTAVNAGAFYSQFDTNVRIKGCTFISNTGFIYFSPFHRNSCHNPSYFRFPSSYP